MATYLITGVNRGIGLELTQQLAANGDQVIAACRSPESAAELQDLVRASAGRIEPVALDVTSDTSVAALKAQLGARPIDVLINNAGVMGDNPQSALEMNFDTFAQVLAVNTIAPFARDAGAPAQP